MGFKIQLIFLMLRIEKIFFSFRIRICILLHVQGETNIQVEKRKKCAYVWISEVVLKFLNIGKTLRSRRVAFLCHFRSFD